jgi:hypothetical protein
MTKVRVQDRNTLAETVLVLAGHFDSWFAVEAHIRANYPAYHVIGRETLAV